MQRLNFHSEYLAFANLHGRGRPRISLSRVPSLVIVYCDPHVITPFISYFLPRGGAGDKARASFDASAVLGFVAP
jgi:hypothetical protein